MSNELLSAEAERFLSAGTIEMSPRLRELFEYLRNTTLSGTAVKEFDIAHEVFGRDASFNDSQDASIRVHVHRLRRKLEAYYADRPVGDVRIVIPKGGYRLALIDPEPLDPALMAPPAGKPLADLPAPRKQNAKWWIAGLVPAVTLLAAVTGYWLGWRGNVDAPAERAAATGFWNGLRHQARVPLLVVGDHYIFGTSNPDGTHALMRRSTINGNDDLRTFIETEKAPPGRYVDLDLYYLPMGTAAAMRDVIPLLRVMATGDRYAPIVTMSQLQPQMIKTSDLIYIGYLSGLGRLQSAVFAGSRLIAGDRFQTLTDRKTNRHFSLSYEQRARPQHLHREFAYLSTFPGPDGNRIVVIAGSGDAGLIQASSVARDEDALRELQRRSAESPNFEALFEVEAASTVPFRKRLLLIAPLDTSRSWRG